MFALSSCWNAARSTDARKMVYEIKQAGFDHIELNFTLSREWIDEIIKLYKEGKIHVVSLHNYCPIPDGIEPEVALPESYNLASLDENERSLAVKYTIQTIRMARELGARAVILHCGRIAVRDRTRDLALVVGNERAYRPTKNLMIQEREAIKEPHFKSALRSLEELLPEAVKNDIRLGVENRYYFREIPSFDEIEAMLDHFEDSHIGYWHDAGHAQVAQNLGFTEQRDFLEKFHPRLIGVHLHDCIEIKDHLCPPNGEVDFEIFKPYMNENVIKVLEIHSPARGEDIVRARDYLTKLFTG